jgi:hypothetical protein
MSHDRELGGREGGNGGGGLGLDVNEVVSECHICGVGYCANTTGAKGGGAGEDRRR